MPTLQSTFDEVLTKIRTQGKPSTSYDDGMICVYYNPETNVRCAAGVLIEPDEYNKGMEGGRVKENDPVRSLLENKGHNIDLVEDLQKAHDYAAFNADDFEDTMDTQKAKIFLDNFEEYMRDAAGKWGLSYSSAN